MLNGVPLDLIYHATLSYEFIRPQGINSIPSTNHSYSRQTDMYASLCYPVSELGVTSYFVTKLHNILLLK